MTADGDDYAQYYTLTPAGAAAHCYTAVFQELPGQEALPDGVLRACEAQGATCAPPSI
jgi:hypothetical protein